MYENIQSLAHQMRKEIIKMVYCADAGHIGGSFSIIDILVSIYFSEGKHGKYMDYDASDPEWEERDYLIMSKGHATPALYACLAEAGFFTKDEFFTFRQVNSNLQGHPTKKAKGVEVSGGSLGQGLSVANGIALGRRDKRVYCILGDGEIQEGQIWEAAMSSAHFCIDNLVAILDKNDYQIDGYTGDIMSLGDIPAKFKAFGWEVFEIDGHNFEAIHQSLDAALKVKGKPAIIIAQTVKGKGVSFMENTEAWHGKAPNEQQYEEAVAELERNYQS